MLTSLADVAAYRRDIRRRNQKYRLAKNPLSYQEEVRNLIQLQTEALAEYLGESKECATDNKVCETNAKSASINRKQKVRSRSRERKKSRSHERKRSRDEDDRERHTKREHKYRKRSKSRSRSHHRHKSKSKKSKRDRSKERLKHESRH